MKIHKKLLLLITVLTSLTACDSPRSQRALSSSSSNSLKNNPSAMDWSNNSNNSNNNNGSTTTAPSTPSTPTTPTSVIPSDASHCKFATDGINGFESTSSHLGEYTLCQSSTDKSITYFQLKTPPVNSNGDISICLIPTTSNGANSIYVGNPMCGYFKNPKDVRKITFIKYAQYSNATITGVIFFKDLSWYYYNGYMMTLEAYKTCMNMLAVGNTAYCEKFKSVNQYVFKQF